MRHDLIMSCFQIAHYSADKRPSFFGNILKNIKEEYSKNTEMQDSLKKFREEAKKLEESDALKEARRKFESIEGTAKDAGGSSVFKDHVKGVADKVKGTIDEVSKTDAAKKATQERSIRHMSRSLALIVTVLGLRK